MCGITGYVGDTAFAPDTLAVMTNRLAHRGPDAGGLFVQGPAHLGHRRLSVIDLAGSTQPMSSADGAVTVVFNGEIYNFRALRLELARGGWDFRTSGDTEVLLAGWHAWGPRIVDRLRGMFAFALWDARDATLFAARDHLGVKPFHYAWDGVTFVFASEIKALHGAPGGVPGSRSCCAAAISRVSVHACAAFHFRRHSQAAPRSRVVSARRAARHPPFLVPRLRRQICLRRRRCRRGA